VSPGRALDRFFFTGYSPESLGLLRIWLAIALALYCIPQFWTLLFLDPLGPSFHFLDPIWYFAALGIERHVPLLTPLAFALVFAAGACAALGYRTRLSLALMILAIVYLKGVRDSFTGDVHHRLLIPLHLTFLLLVSRSGDVLSLDRRRRPRRPLAEWEASWPIVAMQVYCSFFYAFAAVAKLRVSGLEWFGGERIQRLLMTRSVGMGFLEGEGWTLRSISWHMAQSPELCALLGYLTLAFELGFPLILLIRSAKLRLCFLLAVVFFHLSNAVLANINFALMPLMFVVFFDLAEVRKAWAARAWSQCSP
jgi:hypothetical protein